MTVFDELRKQSDITQANEYCERPFIPELPDDPRQLNELLRQEFKVISESTPVNQWGRECCPGEIAISDLELECPFCKMRFTGFRKSGCFTHHIFPLGCPNCNFPGNVLAVLRDSGRGKGG
jgi:hypothetical protein